MQKNSDCPDRYDDIINLPRHVSTVHPQMAVSERAAQFSPFAALTGHGDAIRETARLTDQRIELDGDSREILNKKLQLVIGRLKEQPEVAITYFVPDGRKDGGNYITVDGKIKKFDEYEGLLILPDGTKIPLDDVIEIEGELFQPVGD